MDLKEIGISTRNWVDSAQDRDYRRALVTLLVAYSSQRSHIGQPDFCNWLTDEIIPPMYSFIYLFWLYVRYLTLGMYVYTMQYFQSYIYANVCVIDDNHSIYYVTETSERNREGERSVAVESEGASVLHKLLQSLRWKSNLQYIAPCHHFMDELIGTVMDSLWILLWTC